MDVARGYTANLTIRIETYQPLLSVLTPNRFDLAALADGHCHLEGGHAVPKVVIDVARDLA